MNIWGEDARAYGEIWHLLLGRKIRVQHPTRARTCTHAVRSISTKARVSNRIVNCREATIYQRQCLTTASLPKVMGHVKFCYWMLLLVGFVDQCVQSFYELKCLLSQIECRLNGTNTHNRPLYCLCSLISKSIHLVAWIKPIVSPIVFISSPYFTTYRWVG